jgi:hypothetical protein
MQSGSGRYNGKLGTLAAAMSIPLFDVSELWRKQADEFNEWRANSDLPLLYDFFLTRLPDFEDWASEFQIDKKTFSHTIPTGKLFLPASVLTLVRSQVEVHPALIRSPDNQPPHLRYLPLERDPSEYVRNCQIAGRPVPELKSVVPYLTWGAKRFGKVAFIPNENVMTEGVVFNSWSAVDSPAYSRASIFRNFEVLKLGGVVVTADVSGRNLDFVDLDHLTITGPYHANRQTFVQYSSCRDLAISDADMAFYELRRCSMSSFRCASSKLYKFTFAECEQMESSFVDSKLRNVRFERSGASFDFDHCDLIDLRYIPAKQERLYSFAADVYRQLRIAYQSCGKRHEAAEAYYQERSYERKALARPYLEPEWESAFPPKRTVESLTEISQKWRSKTYDWRVALQRGKWVLQFHARLWLTPKYFRTAVRFKLRYLVTAAEGLVWGYGERPSRIVATATTLLAMYSMAFYTILNANGAKTSITDCVYLSLVTFTTLGYGDITPKTTVMKMACGSEAFIGAFVLGLVVAGFSNRSRY